MLVLTRKPGERIAIGIGITIVVTRISAGRVAIGIDAPQHLQIRRCELARRCKPDRQLTIAK